MITISAASAPVNDTLNPDPGTLWAIVWARADDQSAPQLLEAHQSLEIVPQILCFFPNMSWVLIDCIVEEIVGGREFYRIRFNNAKRCTDVL